MGTRIVYQIRNDEEVIVATLFSNSSHTTQFPENVLRDVLAADGRRMGASALVEKLLAMRYATEEGAHSAGDRIFWLVGPHEADSGDREAVVTVTYEVNGAAPGPMTASWRVTRREV